MSGQTFQVGSEVLVAQDSPDVRYSAFFEDDCAAGYFYALDLSRPDDMILDAVHIYNVKNIVDRDRPSMLCIVWSAEGEKCALLINGYPQAAFDFVAKRGYCRTNFPNLSHPGKDGCLRSAHSWSDDAVAWLDSEK